MVKVYRSAAIDAPVDAVWAYVRDFNALPNWHPLIAHSQIEGGLPSDRVGCVRSFKMKDGGALREQLLALCDLTHSVTYNILESPMPVENYVATLRFTPITVGNGTFAEWWAEFDVTDGSDEATAADIGDNVFVVGFAAINDHFFSPYP